MLVDRKGGEMGRDEFVEGEGEVVRGGEVVISSE